MSTYVRSLLMRIFLTRRVLASGGVLAILLPLAILQFQQPSEEAATICRQPPLAGVPEAERWQVIEPCATISGLVMAADFPSSNGAYWIVLRPDAASLAALPGLETFGEQLLWVKFYPNLFPDLMRPRTDQRISITGALVFDQVYGWQEIVPVWSAKSLDSDESRPAVTLKVEGLINGESVTYSVLIWNNTDQPLGPVYVAATIPAGGISEWLVPSIEPGWYAGPYIYTSPYQTDLAVHAFAHWLSPVEGSITTPDVQPVSMTKG